jgi:hypothetical protein
VLSGGNYFITKPVDPLELALKVTIHLFKAQVQHAPQPETKPEVKPQPAKAPEIAPKPPVPTQATTQQMNGNGNMNGKEKNGDSSDVPLPTTQPRAVNVPEVVPQPQPPVPANPAKNGNGKPKNLVPPLVVAPPVSLTPPVRQRTTDVSKVMPKLSSAPNLAKAGTLNGNILSASGNRNRIMNNEQDETFEKVVVAVVRIIFGDDNLTDMNVRLVRIALERYNVHEIINSPVVV